MKVRETFDIKEPYQTGHAPGLVVVLDALAARDAQELVGRTANVRTPSGEDLHLCIDAAKEHGPVNSLFFRNLKRGDVPAGSDIAIRHRAVTAPDGSHASTSEKVIGGTNQ